MVVQPWLSAEPCSSFSFPPERLVLAMCFVFWWVDDRNIRKLQQFITMGLSFGSYWVVKSIKEQLRFGAMRWFHSTELYENGDCHYELLVAFLYWHLNSCSCNKVFFFFSLCLSVCLPLIVVAFPLSRVVKYISEYKTFCYFSSAKSCNGRTKNGNSVFGSGKESNCPCKPRRLLWTALYSVSVNELRSGMVPPHPVLCSA